MRITTSLNKVTAVMIVVTLCTAVASALLTVHLLAQRERFSHTIPCGELLANCPPMK